MKKFLSAGSQKVGAKAALDEDIPQAHLLPKSVDGEQIGSTHNRLDIAKVKYIIAMRKELCCKNNICFKSGSLNLKYFNVKKGHYWSNKENEALRQAIVEFGPANYQAIQSNRFKSWTTTEIRLRICKLMRTLNIGDYKDVKFRSVE
mmetsp:Transcript_6641/g.10678  ORF Transcript_6641/g.10678 Transcript_6641/m.10678 type:complete len:147 (+) Transcript_6641:30-470(+)